MIDWQVLIRKMDGLYVKNELQVSIQTQEQVVEVNVVVVRFVIQINELHDQYAHLAITLLPTLQPAINDLQAPIQVVDHHHAHIVQQILTLPHFHLIVHHEVSGITALRAIQLDTQFEGTDFASDLSSETMEMQILTMAEAACALLNPDIHVLVGQSTLEMCVILSVEMGSSLAQKLEMIEMDIMEMVDLQLAKQNLSICALLFQIATNRFKDAF